MTVELLLKHSDTKVRETLAATFAAAAAGAVEAPAPQYRDFDEQGEMTTAETEAHCAAADAILDAVAAFGDRGRATPLAPSAWVHRLHYLNSAHDGPVRS